MKIIFLYAELMPNLIPVFNSLVKHHSSQIWVFHWDHKKKTPYLPDAREGVIFYRRSEYTLRRMKQTIEGIDPDLIYVAGWMDRAYLAISVRYRRKGVPIVVGFDDWWKGTARQRIGALLSPLLTKVLFSHAWVAGPRQYEFAKRLGFKDQFIVPNLLSCDTNLFAAACQTLAIKQVHYPNVFLYVGRFSPEKGIGVLSVAFEKYRTEFKGTWKLICVGNGPLLGMLSGKSGIEVKQFSSQTDLMEMMQKSGIFVLASLRDFSPLVVHEAASAGLPMILSSNVGNIPLFMIHNYNGMVFGSGSADALAETMHRMANLRPEELVLMGKRSYELSRRITPEISAASFVSSVTR